MRSSRAVRVSVGMVSSDCSWVLPLGVLLVQSPHCRYFRSGLGMCLCVKVSEFKGGGLQSPDFMFVILSLRRGLIRKAPV
jgi:hypothetical protein